MDPKSIFANKVPVPGGLEAYGFHDDGTGLVLDRPLSDGRFSLHVSVDTEGAVDIWLTDIHETGQYDLRCSGCDRDSIEHRAMSEVVGILHDISNRCFDHDAFRWDQSRRIVRHAWTRYRAEPEFLWKRMPRSAVLRRRDTDKWFGVVMVLDSGKIGLDPGHTVEVMNVRMDPNEVPDSIDGIRIFPAYHMTKRNWVTVLLDGGLTDAELEMMLAWSHSRAL